MRCEHSTDVVEALKEQKQDAEAEFSENDLLVPLTLAPLGAAVFERKQLLGLTFDPPTLHYSEIRQRWVWYAIGFEELR